MDEWERTWQNICPGDRDKCSWGKRGVLHARTDEGRWSRRQINQSTSKGIGWWEGRDQRVPPVGAMCSDLICTRSQDYCAAWGHGWCWNTMHKHTHTHLSVLRFLNVWRWMCRRHHRPMAAAVGSPWFAELSLSSVSQVLGSKSTPIWAPFCVTGWHRLIPASRSTVRCQILFPLDGQNILTLTPFRVVTFRVVDFNLMKLFST